MRIVHKLRDKERAKDIILAIIDSAGGVFDNKTNLFKAFYHAHLKYAETQKGYLSAWPIVRMPKGPGIEHFDMLVGELVAEGALELEQVEKGDCTAFRFSVTSHCPRVVDLPDEAIEAIKYGVRMVQGRTAAAVSEESHRRSWEKTPNGHEMNIYADISSDEEYARHAESFRRISSIVDKVWGQS
jgi:hypothetical protein